MLRLQHLPPIFILLLATALRFWRITGQSLWNDEGNSARLSERSLRLIIEGTASDVHPPLYYIGLHYWRDLLGDSEFALRAFSAVAGILLVALTMAVSELLLGRRKIRLDSLHLTTLFAGLLVAVNPSLLYYAQETRMYMLLPLWMMLATLLLLRWLIRPTAPLLVGYGLVMAAGLYTHYFFPVVFILHALWVGAAWWRAGMAFRPKLIRWIVAVVAACLLFVPWLPNMLNGLGGNRGAPQPPTVFLNDVGQWLLFGEPARELFIGNVAGYLLLGIIPVMVLAVERKGWPVLASWILVPIVLLIALSATDAAFYKFTLLMTPALAIVYARGIARPLYTEGSAMQPYLPYLVGAWMAIMVGISVTHWQDMQTQSRYARDDYRGIAEQISAEAHPNHGIILNAPNQWEVFTYYHDEADAPVYPIPRNRDNAQTVRELEAAAAAHERLYVLYWGDTQQDPEHVVENWLNDNTFKAAESWRGSVRFVTYAAPSAEAITPTAVNQTFGAQIVLREFGVQSAELLPGDIVQTQLNFEALAEIDGRYKIFVHLLNADGHLVAQKDSEPTPFTFDWTQGYQFTGNYGVLLPADLPPGKYDLHVGLYDANDPATRLLLADGANTFVAVTLDIGP